MTSKEAEKKLKEYLFVGNLFRVVFTTMLTLSIFMFIIGFINSSFVTMGITLISILINIYFLVSVSKGMNEITDMYAELITKLQQYERTKDNENQW